MQLRLLLIMAMLAAWLGLAEDRTMAAIPSAPPWGSGYQLTFSQDYTTMTSLSQLGVSPSTIGTGTWIAHTATNLDWMPFENPSGNYNPFGLGGGYLDIRSQQNASTSNGFDGFTGGLLSSVDSTGAGFAQEYGYFEVSMQCPGGTNTWPAFWLLDEPSLVNSSLPDSAEIDIIEEYGNDDPNAVWTSWHDWVKGSSSPPQNGLPHTEPGVTTGYHTYGVDIEPSGITYYMDRQQIWQAPWFAAVGRPMYVLMNLALGGGGFNNAGDNGYDFSLTPNPSDLKVQYVAVWASPNSDRWQGTPIVPSGLTAIPGSSKVALQWSSIASATGYNIYRGTSSGGEGSTPIASGVTSTAGAITASFTDSSVTNGTTYYYKVTSVNSNGESAKSSEASAAPSASIAASASYVKTDSTTQGSWKGVYGSDGYYIATVSPSLPIYALASTGASTYIWTPSTTDVRALQDPSSSTNRLMPTWITPLQTTGSSFSADLNLTDSSSHQIAFYLDDYDYFARQETVTITDAVFGNVLDTETFSSFGNGEYGVWNIKGHVTVTVTTDVNTNGVLSAIFFGGSSSGPLPLAPTGITATAGNGQVTLAWKPSAGAASYNIYRGTVAGVESSTAVATGVTGTSYVNTGLTNGTTYFYKVTAVNSNGMSGASMETSATPNAGSSSVAYLNLDTSTEGNWKGVYGADGYNVIGDAVSYPAYATVTPTDNVFAEWQGSTTDARGLEKVESTTDRIAGVWATDGTSEYINLNLTDGNTHQVALYFVDWDYYGRSETITASDSTTGAVLFSTYLTSFSAGEYVVLNVKGNVTFTVPPVSGNGVITGLFFGGGSGGSVPGAPILSGISGNGQNLLSWNAVSGATSYAIYRGLQHGYDTTSLGTVTSPSYTDTGLSNGTTYYYIVEAQNTYGSSGAVDEIALTPSATATAPMAPANLTAAGGNAQATLSWQSSTGATSYSIFRGTSPGGESATAVATGVTGTSYTNTGLATNTTYYYTVEAVDGTGASGYSNEAFATTTGTVTVPSAPAGLTATAGNGQVSLVWTATAGAASYNVYRGTSSGGEGGIPLASGIAGTTYVDTGRTNGVAYYYKVAAVNSAGTSGYSGEVSATPQLSAPASPTGLTAASGNAQVVLSWTSSAGASTYNVYRGLTAGGESGTAIAAGISATTYTNTGLTNGTAYFYKVAAVNSGGTSGQSNEASATPVAAPGTPTGLTATAGDSQVALSWTAGSGATSYNLYKATSSGGEGATPVVTGITSTTYTDLNLTDGTTYFYKLAAVNSAGTSAQSGEASAMPNVAVPAAPANLAAVAGNALVGLTWSTSSGATSYNVYRGVTAGGESATAIATGLTSGSYSDTGLTNGTAYFYKVAAVNSAGTSTHSSEASATPALPVPAAPTGLTATSGNAQVVLSWTRSSVATSYSVYRGTSPGGESGTAIATGVTNTMYTNTGLTNGTAYFYTVAAVNGAGTSAHSNEASATPESSSGSTVLQINSGSVAVGTWVADTDVVGGTAAGTSATIDTSHVTNPAPQAVYQSVRFGNFTYTIPGLTAGASYTVNLHMVETWWTGPGEREFNVAINGAQVLTDFDLYAATGGENIAIKKSFTATANGSGQISIQFTNVIDSAEVSGIEIVTGSSAPAAPTNLTATAGNAQAVLAWSGSSGATSYNIYRGSVSGGESPTAIATGITTTTYTNTGLTNGDTYFYTVAAVNSSGTSGMSNEASAIPQSAGGGGTAVVQINSGSVAVGTWVADTDVSGGAAAGTSATINTSNVTNPAPQAVYQSVRFGNFTYTIPGLTVGATYTVRLHFVETWWTGPGEREFDVAINGSQVLTDFDIFAAAGGENIALAKSFVATANSSGQITIQFSNVIDSSEVSGVEVLTGTSSGSAPPPPRGLTATAGNGQVVLNWTASAGTVSYNVYRGVTSGGEGVSAIATGVTGTSYTDPGLANSTAYYYTVAAVNSSGSSGASNEASATPTSGGSGGTPVLQIDCAGVGTGTWVADTDVTGGGPTGTSASINTSNVTNPAPQSVYQSVRYSNFTYAIPGLTPGHLYTVNLHMAEIYWTGPGEREFNVAINGSQVLTDFDIYAAAGGENIAIKKSFTATADGSGQITIQFTNVIDNACIGGIEITD